MKVFFQGRTDISIRNRFNKLMRSKRAGKSGISVENEKLPSPQLDFESTSSLPEQRERLFLDSTDSNDQLLPSEDQIFDFFC
jgi:hypothetical protein